jgi:hypothetical protein
MEKLVDKSNIGERILYMMYLFILLIAQLAISLLVKWVLYSRLIKMYLYATFAPIGMSDILSGGFNSRGFKYLKSYVALGFQGIVISVIVFATDTVTSLIANEQPDFTFTFISSYIITNLLLAAMITQSEHLSKEIIGA